MEYMSTDILAALVITSVSGFAALFLGKRLTSWLFELYYHGELISQRQFFKEYDRCADWSTFELLSSLSFSKDTMPQDYANYLQFHEESRQKAYLLFSKRLLERALYSSIILLTCFVIPISLAQSHHWCYLTFPVIIVLQMIYQRFVQRKFGAVMRLATMWGIIIGMSMRRW